MDCTSEIRHYIENNFSEKRKVHTEGVRQTAVKLAEKYGVKMQQIALAWQWAKGAASPIVGATKPQYLDDAVGALDVKLTDGDIAYLEAPYLPHRIVGAIDHNPAEGVILVDEKK